MTGGPVLLAAFLAGLAVFWAAAGHKLSLSRRRSVRLSDERIETRKKVVRSSQDGYYHPGGGGCSGRRSPGRNG
ncbi:MAG: hypothetical protein M1609_16155 [Firmicutes bacterium]|nr:hypothetical protein [Bacillota bacterium]